MFSTHNDVCSYTHPTLSGVGATSSGTPGHMKFRSGFRSNKFRGAGHMKWRGGFRSNNFSGGRAGRMKWRGGFRSNNFRGGFRSIKFRGPGHIKAGASSGFDILRK